MNPKVFISHASEDKESFVLGFAEKLRLKGIDTWVDKWEILPGDSLVDRIFEEGIKNSQAIIVILSNNSVNKPWVREELNAGIVKKINSGSKLIPVVIEDCQVPECLKSTLWEQIKDINNYDVELERIVMSVYGQKEKLPLGAPPKYTKTTIDVLPNLTKIDTIIIKLSCEKAIIIGDPFLDTDIVLRKAYELDIPELEFYETLEILDKRGYIKISRVLGGDIPHFSVTLFGFDEYARVYIDNYSSILESVEFQIINQNNLDSETISSSLNQPQMIINHILDILESNGLVGLSKCLGGSVKVFQISPELKRILKNK